MGEKMINNIIEKTLQKYAWNYNMSINEAEQFRTDREAQSFIDNVVKQPELREHYFIRYEQYKEV